MLHVKTNIDVKKASTSNNCWRQKQKTQEGRGHREDSQQGAQADGPYGPRRSHRNKGGEPEARNLRPERVRDVRFVRALSNVLWGNPSFKAEGVFLFTLVL